MLSRRRNDVQSCATQESCKTMQLLTRESGMASLKYHNSRKHFNKNISKYLMWRTGGQNFQTAPLTFNSFNERTDNIMKREKAIGRRKTLLQSPFLLLTTVIVSFLFIVNIVNAQSLANNFFTEPDVHPGFISKVGPKAFELLSDYLRQRVTKFMKFGALQYKSTVNLTPLVKLTTISVNVLSYDAQSFQSQFSISPEKVLSWTGSNLTTTVNSQFSVFSAQGEMVAGQVPITFDKSTIQIDLQSGVNTDGHLKTDLQKCHAYIGELRLDFEPTESERLRNYLPLIHRAIREQIDNLFCPTFESELVPVIANRLLNTPMSAALFDHYFINYGLIGSVTYPSERNNLIELHHRGNVFGILRQGRTRLNDFRLPFRSAPLPITSEVPNNMVTFHFSNYTIASLLFWMDQYRKFDYEISKNSVNDSNIAGYLRTECGSKDICAGTLFPALAKNFGNGVVSIKTHTVTFPQLKLEKGKVIVVVNSRIDAFVSQPDKNRRFLTATMLAELSVQKATFNDYTLKGQLSMDSFRISDVDSKVDGIDAGTIEFLINALNDLIIADDMAKKLNGGIKLPILFDFDQSHSEIHFEENGIWIGADYCYEEVCKRATVTNNNNNTSDRTKVGQNTDMDVNYYDATG